MVSLEKKPTPTRQALEGIRDIGDDWPLFRAGMRATLPDCVTIWEGLRANNLHALARMLRWRRP